MDRPQIKRAELSTEIIPIPPVWLVALATGSSVLGITLVTPALPLIQAEMGVSANAVQLLLTGYLLMLAIGQLVIGPLADLFGRRPFIMAGAICITFGGMVGLNADDILVLTIARIIQGLGAGACLSMARAMINDALDRPSAARAMATVQTIQATVPVLSLILGGILVTHIGWIGIMAVMTGAGAILTLLVGSLLQETHLYTKTRLNFSFILNAYKQVLKNPVFVGFMIVGSSQVGMFLSMNAFLPYRYESLGISPVAFGLWFALTPVTYFLGNLANRLYLVQKGLETTIIIGCSLCLVSVGLLFFTQFIGITSPLGIALPCCLFGFSNGLTVANSVIGGIKAAGNYAGTGSGLIGAMQMMSGSLLGIFVVWLGGDVKIILACSIVLIVALISWLAAVFLYQTRQMS